jgi:hypothetical protein
MRTRNFYGRLLAAAVTLTWKAASAHHAPTEYDMKIVEIEGTLTEVRWQNPHVRIFVRVTDPNGVSRIVEVEGGALSVMRRTNATAAGLRVGDRVKVAGAPSRRSDTRMLGSSLLQADGTELLFQPGQPARWKKGTLGSITNWFDRNDLEPSRSGIFRVWSSRLSDFLDPVQPPIPFTEAARKRIKAWDWLHDSATHGCDPIGMPSIMDAPYPMEFVRKDDTILLRLEIYDATRTIHMNERVTAEQLPKHLFGRSLGHWEDRTLVVATDGILWPYFDHLGAPLSSQASIVERFTPSADGSLLDYRMVITDPEFLSKPLELQKTLMARRNESVKPYECKAD